MTHIHWPPFQSRDLTAVGFLRCSISGDSTGGFEVNSLWVTEHRLSLDGLHDAVTASIVEYTTLWQCASDQEAVSDSSRLYQPHQVDYVVELADSGWILHSQWGSALHMGSFNPSPPKFFSASSQIACPVKDAPPRWAGSARSACDQGLLRLCNALTCTSRSTYYPLGRFRSNFPPLDVLISHAKQKLNGGDKIGRCDHRSSTPIDAWEAFCPVHDGNVVFANFYFQSIAPIIWNMIGSKIAG